MGSRHTAFSLILLDMVMKLDAADLVTLKTK
jgi:hypothetical protein